MTDSDELHKLSESIYRHLEKSFSPGLRNIIATGKAYHESLSGITAHATSYIESLLKVGHSCKTSCKGTTQSIGEALFAIADTYRQIQVQVEEANKALWTDFLLPLENKVESQFKEIVQSHKRYATGHKSVYGSYEKAESSLRKVRKKSKSKRSINDHDEVEKLKEWEEKLKKFRSQGLKLALLEERKHYCYLLDKCCGNAKINADNHFRAGSMLGRPLSTWQALCEDPMTLPPESAALVALHTDGVSYTVSLASNIHLSPMRNGHLTSPQIGDYTQPHHSYISNAPDHITREHEDPEMTLVSALPPTSRSPRVRAIYTHTGEGENQLSFNEGDVIVLIGDKSDGWHYGINIATNKYGWLPLSFVETMDKGSSGQGSTSGRQRHRSVGDLRENVPDQPPGRGQRPLSMYVANPPMARHNEHPSHVMEWLENVNDPNTQPEMIPDYGYVSSDFGGRIMYDQYSSLPTSYRANQPDNANGGGMYANEAFHATSNAPPSPPLPPPPIPSTLPPPNMSRIANQRSSAYSSPMHQVPPRSSSQTLPPAPPPAPVPPPLPPKTHLHHGRYDFDATYQSGHNNTGPDYQEAGYASQFHDGKPDFWQRGVTNNNDPRKRMPHADYDDVVPGLRRVQQPVHGGYMHP